MNAFLVPVAAMDRWSNPLRQWQKPARVGGCGLLRINCPILGTSK
jgi:hypothetical protein